MSSSRESLSLITRWTVARRYRAEAPTRAVLRALRCWRQREFWGDNFGPMVCRVAGHRPFRASMTHEPEARGCRRCGRYIDAPEEPDAK